MPKSHFIFICYRREDSAGHAGRLYDRLCAHFGEEQVFMDIDTVEPGVDFVEAIESAVSSCRVLVAVIGKQWLSIKDAEGERRLDNPEDFVRLELSTALERNIRVIPVLMNGATMPRSTDLPAALSKLARRNALDISDSRWRTDVERLIRILENALKESDGVEAARPAAVSPDASTHISPTNASGSAPSVRPSAPPATSPLDFSAPPLPPTLTQEQQQAHKEMHRFARLLASEIKFYNEQQVRDGQAHGDIYSRLREDIDRARAVYEKRQPTLQMGDFVYDYFHHALIATLAGGDPSKMGSDYPGESRAPKVAR